MSETRGISEDALTAMKAFVEDLPQRNPALIVARAIAKRLMQIKPEDFTHELVYRYSIEAQILSKTLNGLCTFHEDISAPFSNNYFKEYLYIETALQHYKAAAKYHGIQT